jgi:hypothetical protein
MKWKKNRLGRSYVSNMKCVGGNHNERSLKEMLYLNHNERSLKERLYLN